jgi:hypothetical protein
LVWTEKGLLRFAVLLSLFAILFGLYGLLKNSSALYYSFFPFKPNTKKPVGPNYKGIYYASMGLFWLALVFAILEIDNIDNTIRGLKLFWQFGLTGISISIALLLLIELRAKSVYNIFGRRFSISIALLLGLFLLLPTAASFYNRMYTPSNLQYKKYAVVSKNRLGSRYKSNYINVTIENEIERLKINDELYYKLEVNDSIELGIKKGALGFDFVQTIKAVH